MENNKANNLAEQIAVLLGTNDKGTDDFAVVRASLERINNRLDRIEAKLDSQNSESSPASGFKLQQTNHPSQHRFAALEAIADDIIEQFETEKSCPYEPTGKACDHCSMCSSRGF